MDQPLEINFYHKFRFDLENRPYLSEGDYLSDEMTLISGYLCLGYR